MARIERHAIAKAAALSSDDPLSYKEAIIKRFMFRAGILGVILAASPAIKPAQGQNTTGFGSAELDVFVGQKMEQARVHGLSVLVVRNDQVLWAKGFGFADYARTTPATPNTPFYLASISKTFTASAVLQLWEQGKLGLDDDVNDYLPFSIRNPAYPNTPITFRHLLSHYSSINARDALIPYTPGMDCPISLRSFLEDRLVPGGAFYEGAYGGYPPGAGFQYANVDYALLGYLVERISGKSFEKYCLDHLFSPLGMVDTSWRMTDFPSFGVAPAESVAINLDTKAYDPVGFGGWAAYPAATLTTSANQLGKWLIAQMNGGNWQGVQILQPSTVQLLQTPVFSNGVSFSYGLGFAMPLRLTQAPELHIGHNGSFPGILSVMAYRPRTGIGVIILSTGGAEGDVPNVQLGPYGDIAPGGWQRANIEYILDRLMEEGAAAR